MKQNRYPGVNPFETHQRDRFFGRRKDIEDLGDLILLEKVTVLFGRSGYGKSSLINAGIIPFLQTEQPEPIVPLLVRFGAYVEGVSQTPLGNLVQRLEEKVPLNPMTAFLDTLVDKKTLWYHFKRRQTGEFRKFILIFDQAEEFFSYPTEAQNQFKLQLAELIYQHVPQNIRDEVSEMNRPEREFISTGLQVHALFSVREDRLSLLDDWQDYLPTILHKRYGLQALDRAQAAEAITAPALLPGSAFASPPFQYSGEALELILKGLIQSGTTYTKARIEAFQLQIVCQYIEGEVLRNAIRPAVPEGLITVQPADLPDITRIYEEYYRRRIEQLPAELQEAARTVIEEGLLLEDSATGEGRRLSLDADLLVRQYGGIGVTHTLLQQLENTFLLRREANSLGGFNYEISHDTLIAPILKTKRDRMADLIREQELALVRKQAEIDRQKRNRARAIAALVLLIGLVWAFTQRLYLYTALLTLTSNPDKPALPSHTRLHQALEALSAQLEREGQAMYKDSLIFFESPWATSQAITALNGRAKNVPLDAYLNLVKRKMVDTCCCWSEIKAEKDFRASGWIAGTLERTKIAYDFPCEVTRFFLDHQMENGAWSMILMGPDKLQYSSTYATCHALLTLHYALQNPDISPALKPRIESAVQRGADWLLKSRFSSTTALWRDYAPYKDQITIVSQSISALVMHTLNILGKQPPEQMVNLNRIWMESLDLNEAKNFAIDFKEQSSYFYQGQNGESEIFHDATRHLVVPWQIIATVDAYKDGSIDQKIRANLWLSTIINGINIAEIMNAPSFVRAEILIGLRFLDENKIVL